MPKKWDLSPKKPLLFDDESADLRHALQVLADEMNSFQNFREERSFYDCPAGPTVVEDICKSSLTFKEDQMNQLRGRLKMACEIARVAVSFTENKVVSKSNNEQTPKRDFEKSNGEKVHCLGILDKITRENTTSALTLEVLLTVIELGYNKLQKMLNKTPDKELDIASKLNQIIFACGQFYVDYYDEREKCEKYKVQNIQLTNSITSKNEQMRLLREELHRLRQKNVAFPKKGIKKGNTRCRKLEDAEKNHVENKCEDKANLFKDPESICISKSALKTLKLDSHSHIIQSLLEDHENMVCNLKAITKELNKTCKCM